MNIPIFPIFFLVTLLLSGLGFGMPSKVCRESLSRLEGHEFTVGELLSGIVGIQSGHRLNSYSRELRAELRLLADVPYDELLKEPETQLSIVRRILDVLGKPTFEKLVGEQGQPLVHLARQSSPENNPSHDHDPSNMERGFGYQLLAADDPTFFDPTYLARRLATTDAVAPGYPRDRSRSYEVFQRAWDRLAPRARILDMTITGSDANSLLSQILLPHFKQRNPSVKSVRVVSFKGMWGGTKGTSRDFHSLGLGMNFEFLSKSETPYILGSPVTYSLSPSPEEIARLAPIEDLVLKKLRKWVTTAPQSRPIGGVILEPILGPSGVLFYQTSFLLRLRALCDELGIPIIADEILTCGGRTGKFFGFEHYPGFEPDLLTFGKGVIVSGIATYVRTRAAPKSLKRFDFSVSRNTTIQHHPEPLLKAAQILTRIANDNLMKNAQEVGNYFLEALRKRHRDDPNRPIGDSYEPRGVGLLLYLPHDNLPLKTAMRRLLPMLTLSTQDVDQLLDITPTKAAAD